jgi:hypothetical protein
VAKDEALSSNTSTASLSPPQKKEWVLMVGYNIGCYKMKTRIFQAIVLVVQCSYRKGTGDKPA